MEANKAKANVGGSVLFFIGFVTFPLMQTFPKIPPERSETPTGVETAERCLWGLANSQLKAALLRIQTPQCGVWCQFPYALTDRMMSCSQPWLLWQPCFGRWVYLCMSGLKKTKQKHHTVCFLDSNKPNNKKKKSTSPLCLLCLHQQTSACRVHSHCICLCVQPVCVHSFTC